jgi:hypothetical protein
MPVESGQKITAADWNDLTERLNKIFADKYPGSAPSQDMRVRNLQSYGWGQVPSNLVTKGQKFTAAIANDVIDKVKIGARQVGSSYTLNNVTKGQKITALSINQISTVIDDIDPKRYTAAANQLSFAFLGATAKTTSWTQEVIFLGVLAFNNYDGARHYFNSGSSIKLTLSIANGNAASNVLNGLYERLGTVNIALKNTTSSTTNTPSEGKGFEDLNSTDWTRLLMLDMDQNNWDYGYGYGGNNGYGYGYGNCYGYGYGSYGYGYNNGYGYGYGGHCIGSVEISGKIENGNVLLKTSVKTKTTNPKTGTHRLIYNTQKAIDKTSGAANFHIIPPTFSGSVS